MCKHQANYNLIIFPRSWQRQSWCRSSVWSCFCCSVYPEVGWPGSPPGPRNCRRHHKPSWAPSCSLSAGLADNTNWPSAYSSPAPLTLVTWLQTCWVTGRHSIMVVSLYIVSHTVSDSVQQVGLLTTGSGATGAGAELWPPPPPPPPYWHSPTETSAANTPTCQLYIKTEIFPRRKPEA